MKRKKQRVLFTRRALVLGGVQLLAFGTLMGRLYEMQVLDHRRYRRLARNNAISERLIAPERGLITDRNGAVLAGNRQQWRALFLMTASPDPEMTISRIDSILKLAEDDRARLRALLAGPTYYLPVLIKNDLDWQEMADLEVHRPDLPGVIIDRGFVRTYPLGAHTAHTVGYVIRPDQQQVARDPILALPGARIGGSGVEQTANAVLLGSPGVVEDEVNAGGSIVRVINRTSPRQGQTVQLTIDTQLQQAANAALDGRPGSAVLMDARTGNVLAMASTPSFDPSWFDSGVPEAVWKQWTAQHAHHPLTDRSTQGLYAPGSSFKPTVSLAALRCGAITEKTRFFCPGHMKIGNRMFYCWLRSGHGWMDVVSALQQSCDVFFYHVALSTGIDHMAAMGQRLGLTEKPRIALPAVAEGFLPTLRWARQRHILWTEGDTAVQGIGQGYTVFTPLALTIMAARVATGYAIHPRLIRTIGETDKRSRRSERLKLSDRHLALVRQGMAEVVNTPLGTAWGGRLELPDVQMAGKTGTAQVIGESAAMEAGNYNDSKLPWKDRPNALFIGYAPIKYPRFAAAVVIEHGTLLAPVKVARSMFETALSQQPTFDSTVANNARYTNNI